VDVNMTWKQASVRREGPFLADQMHLSPVGHQLVADSMSDPILVMLGLSEHAIR
jgi:hypothetical protein